jgi:hypothetical protein
MTDAFDERVKDRRYASGIHSGIRTEKQGIIIRNIVDVFFKDRCNNTYDVDNRK